MSDDVTPVQDFAKDLRAKIETAKQDLLGLLVGLKDGDIVEENDKTDKNEQIANAMLAFRHLEDAKMRIGKVIQATVGESVYDTPASEGEEEGPKGPAEVSPDAEEASV